MGTVRAGVAGGVALAFIVGGGVGFTVAGCMAAGVVAALGGAGVAAGVLAVLLKLKGTASIYENFSGVGDKSAALINRFIEKLCP